MYRCAEIHGCVSIALPPPTCHSPYFLWRLTKAGAVPSRISTTLDLIAGDSMAPEMYTNRLFDLSQLAELICSASQTTARFGLWVTMTTCRCCFAALMQVTRIL